MKKNVFICHSSKDAAIANALCTVLESMCLKCWISPRDVPPGSRFPREIIKAIEKSDAFVMVFSQNSNTSDHAVNEVERAFSKKIRIFPFRIDHQIPTDDLEYFLSITHWFEVSGSDIRASAKALGDAIIDYLKSGTILPVIEEKTTISPLIDQAFYPIATALNDIRELELQEHPGNTELSSHLQSIEDAAFQLIDVLIKFLTFALLSWYRKLPEEQANIHIDSRLPSILDPKTEGWLQLLKLISKEIDQHENVPGLIQNLNIYLHTDYSQKQNTCMAIEEISKSANMAMPQDKTLIAWLEFMVQFENEFKNSGARPTDLKKQIKESLVEMIACCDIFNKMELASVTSVSPNKNKEGFDHSYHRWHGLEVQPSDHLYSTSGWDFIESSHVFLFDPLEKDIHLDLFPFLMTDEETGAPLQWYKSSDISHISYKKINDRNVKECYLSAPDILLEKIKKHFLEAGEQPAHNIFVTFDDLAQILASHEKFLTTEVKNPLLIKQITDRLALYRQQINNQATAHPEMNFVEWLPKINKLKLDMTLGSYAKLVPTKHEDALTDAHGGVYFIPERFLQKRPEILQPLEELKKLISKASTTEVQVLFYLAFAEATRNGKGCTLGVEHFMIALSKICDPFVFDWYDAIGVPPKYHRDATRYLLAKFKAEQAPYGKVVIKKRLSLVFNMITEEVNLAKRDEVTLKDVLSAILREGNSLPLHVLRQVFNLTNDRILGDFFHLLRTT